MCIPQRIFRFYSSLGERMVCVQIFWLYCYRSMNQCIFYGVVHCWFVIIELIIHNAILFCCCCFFSIVSFRKISLEMNKCGTCMNHDEHDRLIMHRCGTSFFVWIGFFFSYFRFACIFLVSSCLITYCDASVDFVLVDFYIISAIFYAVFFSLSHEKHSIIRQR